MSKLKVVIILMVLLSFISCQSYRPAPHRVDVFSDQLDELVVKRANARSWIFGLGIGIAGSLALGTLFTNLGFTERMERDPAVILAITSFGLAGAATIGEVIAIANYLRINEEYYDLLRLQFQYYNILTQ